MARFYRCIVVTVLCTTALACTGCPRPRDAQTEVVAADQVLGSANAPVTVIQYADFACEACRVFATEVFPTIQTEYIDTGQVRWVWRHLTDNPAPAVAGECAGEQDRFWEFAAEALTPGAGLDRNALRTHAADVGLNLSSFDACMASGRFDDKVLADIQAGLSSGVFATPTFIVNGRVRVGAASVDEMRDLIESALAGE